MWGNDVIGFDELRIALDVKCDVVKLCITYTHCLRDRGLRHSFSRSSNALISCCRTVPPGSECLRRAGDRIERRAPAFRPGGQSASAEGAFVVLLQGSS
jgi:hypothetical protein